MSNNLLLYDGNMVGSVLHAFVPIVEASKHAKTLTHLFQVSGTRTRSCFHHTKMAMFGNKHSHNDFTTDRWVLNLFIAMYTCLLFCSFHILNKFTFVHQDALKHNNISKKLWTTYSKKIWKPLQMHGQQSLWTRAYNRMSWLQELNTLFPKELPFNIAHLGTTCFPTMKIP
jgi:hypothetical protein